MECRLGNPQLGLISNGKFYQIGEHLCLTFIFVETASEGKHTQGGLKNLLRKVLNLELVAIEERSC